MGKKLYFISRFDFGFTVTIFNVISNIQVSKPSGVGQWLKFIFVGLFQCTKYFDYEEILFRLN